MNGFGKHKCTEAEKLRTACNLMLELCNTRLDSIEAELRADKLNEDYRHNVGPKHKKLHEIETKFHAAVSSIGRGG